MSREGMTATVIATELAQAVMQDMAGDGCDVSAGLYGPAASAYIRKLAAALPHPQAASSTQADDEDMARHWIDRYAAGIDDEPQMDRIREALASSTTPASGGSHEP